ncbi:hypothetical protein [Pedobacter nyackensis]|uniref:immunoglobulin domain-containing protein n=1 Tax=Pedobacter nyackensis TaxID=475255 RepID=UPI00292FB640|nr:hypothetical protein [Pedobacter nyackensis]
MRSFTTKNTFIITLLTLLLVVAGYDVVKGQDCGPKERIYASTQSYFGVPLLTSITLRDNAIDLVEPGNMETFSTLKTNVGLVGLGTASQVLGFPSGSLPVGDNKDYPISIKIATGSTVLDVLSGITVQATWNGSPVGLAVSGTNLLGLLGGTAQNIVTFTPGAKYNGVRVIINPIVDIGTSVNIYYAYFAKPITGNTQVCDQPSETINGSTGSILGGLNSVETPRDAIDNVLTTFAKLNFPVSVLNTTYLTAIYPSVSIPGDYVNIVMQADNSAVLTAQVLSTDLQIKLFNGSTEVLSVPGNSPLLSINLLGSTGSTYTLKLPVNVAFDRISLAAGGGLATLLGSLKVYEIQRVALKPEVMALGLIGQNLTICEGQTQVLNISNIQTSNCITYTWYKTGTIPSVGTGTSYTLPTLAPGSHIYTVKATRTGCNEYIESIPITVTVNPLPLPPTILPKSICVGTSTELNIDPASPSTLTYKWYNVPTGGSVLNEGTSFNTPTLTADKYYYVESVITATGCISATRTIVKVTVNPKPGPPQLHLTIN